MPSNPISEEELLNIIKKLKVEPEATDIPDHGPAGNDPTGEKGWIKVENNKIIIGEQADDGILPYIQAAVPVILRKNGNIVQGRVPVAFTDKLEWEIEKKPLFKIEVSADKMKAHFRLLSKNRYDWKLLDKRPSVDLIIEAEEDAETILETVNLADVMNTLQRMSITKNLKPALIYHELQSPTYEPILIAVGIDPTESRDAHLEIYFDQEVESSFQEVAGNVDFRNHLRIPSVNRGDIIAKKIPLVEGMVGYDIYSNIVRPKPPKDIVLVAKDHVEINAGSEVIALKEGRPRITGQTIKYFDISTAFVVPQDVDIKTGNIVFSGDVIVYGNVTDGMIVESLGNIYVSGNVYRATLSATGSIVVKGNTVGSKLYSGYFGVIFNRLYVSAKKLAEMLKGLVEASKLLIQIVEAKGKSISPGQVFMTLVENKFKEIPTVVRDIMTCIHNVQNINSNELAELKTKLELLLNPYKIVELNSYSYLYNIQNLVQETFQSIERMQEVSVQIDINQCHLSGLKSNGNILIRREGVVQSNLYAKDHILFYDQDSVCRGSQLEAGGTISAMNVGGETGGENFLKAGKKITLSRITFGRVSVGRYSQEIFEPMERVAIYENQKGLVIESDSPL